MDTFRYIITRACLQEGSLRLQRSLRPHFPAEGQVKLFDDTGHEYSAQISGGERLLGVGPFYRDHNLGVNDVVMITPLLPGCYKLAGIVKPYARPEPERERERAAPHAGEAASDSSVRVVVNATAHVREVRTQRPEVPVSRPWASMERETAQRAEQASRYIVPPLGSAQIAGPQPEANTEHTGPGRVHRINVPEPGMPQSSLGALRGPGGPQAPGLHKDEAQPKQSQLKQSQPGQPRPPTEAPPSVTAEPSRTGLEHPIPHNLKTGEREMGELQVMVRPVQTSSVAPQSTSAPTAPPEPLRPQRAEGGGSASAASQRLLRDLAAAPAEVRRASRSGGDLGKPGELFSSSGLEAALPAGGMIRADSEHLLETLGRRWGYRVDYPSPDLTRLRAELGIQAYTVLVATGGAAVNSAEWRSPETGTPTYRLWLTSEAQATLDAPVVTHEALRQLSGAQTRLSPLNLQALWEMGALNENSARALTEQCARDGQEDAAFGALLRALAQHPVHGLVTSARLADQLSEVEPALLNRLLTLLTRPPFRLLSHLGGGQYLLLQEVPELLKEMAQSWQTLAGQLDQRVPGSAQPTAESAGTGQSWTVEQLLS